MPGIEVYQPGGSGSGGGEAADADLDVIAALDSTTAGALVTDGAGWIRKSYAALKVALALVTADVTGAVDTGDSRLSNARTPTAHKATHATGGGDALVPSDIGAEPHDPDLSTLAALDATSVNVIASDGAGWIGKTYATFKTALALVKGDVGLGNVDNTADASKPVSSATTTALGLKANVASPALTGTPAIAAATGTSLAVTGALTSSGGGVGYKTGAGGTVTQLTSRTTGVTLNKLSGTITLFTATLAADTDVSFVLSNTFIAAGDVLVIDVTSGAAIKGGYVVNAACVGTAATITVHNVTPTITASEAPVLTFVLIKGVTA